MMGARERAECRVEHDPQLFKHAATILYDWDEGDEHWDWVTTTHADEIIDWAETVELESAPIPIPIIE